MFFQLHRDSECLEYKAAMLNTMLLANEVTLNCFQTPRHHSSGINAEYKGLLQSAGLVPVPHRSTRVRDSASWEAWRKLHKWTHCLTHQLVSVT
jgi:hypothetical protein